MNIFWNLTPKDLLRRNNRGEVTSLMLGEDGSLMINFHRIGQIFVDKFIPKTHEECNQILRAQNNPAPFENLPPLNDLEKELQARNKEIDRLNLEMRKLRMDMDRQQDEFNRRLEELGHSQYILSQPLPSTSNGLNMQQTTTGLSSTATTMLPSMSIQPTLQATTNQAESETIITGSIPNFGDIRIEDLLMTVENSQVSPTFSDQLQTLPGWEQFPGIEIWSDLDP